VRANSRESCQVKRGGSHTAYVHMNPATRSLYRRLLFASRDYPTGAAVARSKLHDAFTKQAALPEADVPAVHAKGEFVLKELEALAKLRKYRALKKRYY